MAKFIGSEVRTGNYGEDVFCQALIDSFPDNYIIYRNRQVFGREFDVAMLIPNVGIVVFEVKGWREATVLRVENGDSIIIKVNGGEEHAAPQKQVRGYRFAIERRLQQDLGAKPIVFGMVVYPQISEAFYRSKGLSAISEPQFTILKDDLVTSIALQTKLAEAVNEVQMWRRPKFDEEFMYNTRCLFEGDIARAFNKPEIIQEIEKFPQPAYSIFLYQPADMPFSNDELTRLAQSYITGTKIYAVVGNNEQLQQIVTVVDNVLRKKSLCRQKNNLVVQYEAAQTHYPAAPQINNNFSAFNCSVSVLSRRVSASAFQVINGREGNHHEDLVEIGAASGFNYDQFEVEHAPIENNILIRAGAGTGKTFTMISRIGFIAYSLSGTILDLLDRITMITFTNEAADQMRKRLKDLFRNYYLLTENILWLLLVCNIDQMQISTIDSYAKKLIDSLGIELGYGCDIAITSGSYSRQQYVAKLINEYIKYQSERSADYISRLGIPMYQLIAVVTSFIEKLQSKNVDVAVLKSENFGSVVNNGAELHKLMTYIIPRVEHEYQLQLRKDNKIHLNSLMSTLQMLINDPFAQRRIATLKDTATTMYMFVDEFQDTDNTQIDILVRLSVKMGFRLFVVGDVKQCIYRFRGATEEAFAQLPANLNWKEYALKRNYRTDTQLLSIFDKAFAVWGAPANKYLKYVRKQDQLIGTKQYNTSRPRAEYYRKIRITNSMGRMEALLDEIQRVQSWIETDIRNGVKLSEEERTIAILVRENWQAEEIKSAAASMRNIQIKTNTGGDLYQTSAAIDLLTLVNALLHYDEPAFLFSLLASNFFGVDVPYSELFETRQAANEADLWNPGDGRNFMCNYLTQCLDKGLRKMPEGRNSWEKIISALRTEPVLQIINQLYDALNPAIAYAKGNEWEYKCYKMNVDLLFEQIFAGTNTDNLTINSFANRLNICIMSGVSVNSRVPEETDAPSIQCITVHKAKGLEYGHVIIPYASFPIDKLKKAKLNVSTTESPNGIQIGYSVERPDDKAIQTNSFYCVQDEIAERYREETRILYVAMTRAIRSFSWICQEDQNRDSWQTLIEPEED